MKYQPHSLPHCLNLCVCSNPKGTQFLFIRGPYPVSTSTFRLNPINSLNNHVPTSLCLHFCSNPKVTQLLLREGVLLCLNPYFLFKSHYQPEWHTNLSLIPNTTLSLTVLLKSQSNSIAINMERVPKWRQLI